LASSNSKHPVALTIAGSDPGGGAGLQADVKTFAALGVYGYSVITEVIAQNSIRVGQVENVSPEMVEAQLNILALECAPRAVKTGALANAAIVKAVARTLERLKMPAPVVDPVIVSSSGALLIGPKGERAIRKRLLPIARIVTPNIPEAEVLSRIRIDSEAAIREAAIKIIKLGARAVVIKGGHRKDDAFATDLFYDGRRFIVLKAPRIAGGGAHGRSDRGRVPRPDVRGEGDGRADRRMPGGPRPWHPGIPGQWRRTHVVRRIEGVDAVTSEQDQGELRPPAQYRVEVHFLQMAAPVVHLLSGHDLQPVDHLLGPLPSVTLDESDDDIGTPAQSPVALAEHGVGLADARGRAQVDPEAPGRLYRAASIRVPRFACRHLIAHVFQSGSR